MKAELVAWIFDTVTRRTGAQITPVGGGKPFLLEGPTFAPGEPIGAWVHFTITFLITYGLLSECDRAPQVEGIKRTSILADFTWGDDDGHDSKTATLARVNPPN